MHDLINKAEWRSHDDVVANLLPNLKDAVFDAEDLIDEFRWYEKKVQAEGNASQSPFIDFFDTVIQGSFNKLTVIQSRLNHLSIQLEKMELRGVAQRFDTLVRPETSSSLSRKEKYIFFGRDKELKQVLGFLNVLKRKRTTSSMNASTNTSASNHVNSELSLPVFGISGIGGVGKTKLAQHIFSHQQVESQFEKIIWICVSDNFDVKRLTKE
uniref:NB-ARC domain-containing protein n=1 Tax=Triticum urartu TaxID=4572 RepID=A0A8R7PM82_TRIUA